MNRSRRYAFAAAAVAVSVGVAVPAAFASTSTTSSTGATLSAIKARAAAAISVRQSALNAGISAVDANKWLTSADKATILGTFNSDLSGLTALGPKIQADTTVTQARSDYRTIFTSYRVFALALPQGRLAAASDDITTGVLPRLNDADTRLKNLLAGPDSGKNTAQVQAAMADLAAQIQTVTTATSGFSANLLALTPAQYDADHAILTGPRSTLLTARADIAKARGDIKTVVQAIK